MATGQAYPPGAHTGFRDRIQGVVGVMIASSTLLNEMCDKIAELEQANQKAVEDLDSEKASSQTHLQEQNRRSEKEQNNLLEQNRTLQQNNDGLEQDKDALKERISGLQESNRRLTEEKRAVHENNQQLEADVRQHRAANRALREKDDPRLSMSSSFRHENSRSSRAARDTHVNYEILKREYRIIDGEHNALMDIPLTMDANDPFLLQLLRGPKLCKWFYLKGICKNIACRDDHSRPKLAYHEMDRLLYLGRKDICRDGDLCADRKCFFAHSSAPANPQPQSTSLKRVKEEDSASADPRRVVRARH